jgi:hypothetical protein
LFSSDNQGQRPKKFTLDRVAKPPYAHGDGAYHYVLAQVDGDRISLEVIGVDWGAIINLTAATRLFE